MKEITGTLHTLNITMTQLRINKDPENKIELPPKVNLLRANIMEELSSLSMQAVVVLITDNKAQYIFNIYEEVPEMAKKKAKEIGISLEIS